MSFSIFLTFSIILLTLLCLFSMMKKKRIDMNARKLHPAGPKKLPILGNLHQLGKLPHRSFQKLSKIYGDPMFLQLGFVPTLIVSSVDTVREIYKTHDLVFSGRPRLYAAKKLTYDFSSMALATYGEYWRQVRKIVVLELMTPKRVQSFGKVRNEEVGHMVNCITRYASDVVDLSALTFSLSNNVVSRAAFGTSTRGKSNGVSNEFQEILLETQHLVGEFNIADYFPHMAWVNKFNGVDKRLDKNFHKLDTFLDRIIKEHLDLKRPTLDQEDIVDVLLRIQKDPSPAIPLTDENIKGIILVDIFSAGTDTTSATIDWTMAELIRNPQVKARAQQEVRKVAKGKQKVEESDLQELTYLKLVIKESWRLHPPAPLMIPKETTEDCIIENKYEIPAKTRVIFNAAAIGTDPKHWENADKFWPERFLNSQIDFRGQHFELLPFGSGRRGCPGINFAVPLVELALANLLFLFDWELPKGMSVKDLDMEEAVGITMHKKIPLCLVASCVQV